MAAIHDAPDGGGTRQNRGGILSAGMAAALLMWFGEDGSFHRDAIPNGRAGSDRQPRRTQPSCTR